MTHAVICRKISVDKIYRQTDTCFLKKPLQTENEVEYAFSSLQVHCVIFIEHTLK